MKHAKMIALLLLIPFFGKTQSIEVADLTIRVKKNSEEKLTYGFAEGDKILFSFQEAKNKKLKEVIIKAYPNQLKFSDYKTAAIDKKTIKVSKSGVYTFTFKNSNKLSSRICKVKISRIPANETLKDFDTEVQWVTERDTTIRTYTKKIIVGYDTTYVPKIRRVLVSSEKQEQQITTKSVRVNSITHLTNPNKTSTFFALPPHQKTDYEEKRVIAWAYWVGVGEEAQAAWRRNNNMIKTLSQTAGNFLTPLGALALGTVTQLAIPTTGEDIKYTLLDRENEFLFRGKQPYGTLDYGKGIATYKYFTHPSLMQGTYFVRLENDNYRRGVNVDVKAIAIIEHKVYKDEEYTKTVVTPIKENKIFKEPVINTKTFPVTSDYKN